MENAIKEQIDLLRLDLYDRIDAAEERMMSAINASVKRDVSASNVSAESEIVLLRELVSETPKTNKKIMEMLAELHGVAGGASKNLDVVFQKNLQRHDSYMADMDARYAQLVFDKLSASFDVINRTTRSAEKVAMRNESLNFRINVLCVVAILSVYSWVVGFVATWPNYLERLVESAVLTIITVVVIIVTIQIYKKIDKK